MSVESYPTDSGVLWRYSVTLKGKSYSCDGFPTSDEAMLAEAKLVETVLDSSSSVSLGSVLGSYSAWLRRRLKRSSYEKWLSRERRYFSSLPSESPFLSLGWSVLSSWWNGLGCSPDVRKRLVHDLRSVSGFARVYLGVENPNLEKLEAYKDYSLKRFSESGYVLSFADFERLVSFEEKEFWRLLFLLSFVGALRVGEVRGLCPDSFDFEKGTMEIFRQVVNLKGGQEVTSPKTDSSLRLVYLPRQVSEMVGSFVSERGLSGTDFLFSLRPGKAVGGSSIDRRLHLLQSKAGLPFFRFHCFRRSEASLLNDVGLSGEVISAYLGHSSFAVTKKFYLGDNRTKRELVRSVLEERISGLISGNKKSG